MQVLLSFPTLPPEHLRELARRLISNITRSFNVKVSAGKGKAVIGIEERYAKNLVSLRILGLIVSLI